MIHAALALAGFTLRRMVAGKRFASAIVILLLVQGVALLVGSVSKAPAVPMFNGLMIELGTYLLPILLTLIYAIALTGGEIEEGTAPLVLLSAVPKWLAVLIQVVVTTFALTLAAVVGAAGCWGIVRMTGSGEMPGAWLIWRYAIVLGAATLAYLSLFTMLGYAFRRGAAVCVAVAVIWEMMQAKMPVKFAAFTITNNVRALIVPLALKGEKSEYDCYNVPYDFPTYGQALLFLSIVVACALIFGMIAAMSRPLTMRESA